MNWQVIKIRWRKQFLWGIEDIIRSQKKPFLGINDVLQRETIKTNFANVRSLYELSGWTHSLKKNYYRAPYKIYKKMYVAVSHFLHSWIKRKKLKYSSKQNLLSKHICYVNARNLLNKVNLTWNLHLPPRSMT